MAVLVVCAVRDAAVDAYLRPFFVATVGMAIRTFSDEVVRPESEMFRHPEDYEMFELGVFDEQTGRFEMLATARAIARAKDFSRAVVAGLGQNAPTFKGG